VWMGRGLSLLGVSGGVSERQLELLFGEGRHPEADRIETMRQTAGDSPQAAARRTRLGRLPERPGSSRVSVMAWDLTFRPPPTITLLWALGNDATRVVIEGCHEMAFERVLAWVEDTTAWVRWGAGGVHRGRVQHGLIAVRFRHFDNRDQQPLLHDHVLVSVKVRRPDGAWGNLDSRALLENAVAAGALYNLLVMEEVCERLGLASEPRTVMPGRRPVMEIAGIPHALIAWTATRSRATRARLAELDADYQAAHGHEPGEEARYRLSAWAAEDTRPRKKTPLPLPTLRARWRRAAITRFGAGLIDGLLARARRVAAAIRDRAQPAVDIALAALDVAAVVYVMRGGFRERHLLAEARRYLVQALRGRRHEPGLDERIVQTAIRAHCTDVTPTPRPGGRPRPPEYRTYTAAWTPAELGASGRAGAQGHAGRRLSKFERARIATVLLQSRLRTTRTEQPTVAAAQRRRNAPTERAVLSPPWSHQLLT
jgi:conjugative relaxase-like TrwC/TraI family protein